MSDEPSHSKNKVEKKSRPRACDQCRRRKVRCNGGEIPAGNRCANCISFEFDCTYTSTSNKKQSDAEYIKTLEEEIAALKKQLQSPSTESSELSARLSSLDDSVYAATPQHQGGLGGSQTPAHLPGTPAASPATESTPHEDTDHKEELVELLDSMNLGVRHTHYLGRASSLVFVRTAGALKREFASLAPPVPRARVDIFAGHQPEFLDATAKLIYAEPPHPYSSFPEPTLMQRLVQEYFVSVNNIFALLHRPTFEHNIRTGLHFRDYRFGSTVLLVCAIGARFTYDEAVLPEGTKSWHWSGWTWFQQVNTTRRFAHTSAPWVYDLQICFLMGMYIAVSPVPHATHSLIGHGLRLAYDMGAHRRVGYGSSSTVENELKKRAFWCLVMLDRMMCDKLGRPYNIDDEDFEVEFPVECDDKYWVLDGSSLIFAQPPGQPSTIAAFNCMLRFTIIHAKAYRAIYHQNPSRLRSDAEYAQQIVLELDSQLNGFIDSVPAHLRWYPHRPVDVFTNQSAFIYSSYYYLQIIIHRAFVPLPQRPSTVSFPSLAICTNAARSALHIMDVQFSSTSSSPQAYWHPVTLFTCATVLLLNLWNAKKVGIAPDTTDDIRDVQRALSILKTFDKSVVGAARLGCILEEVMETFARSQSPMEAQLKRKRRESANEDVTASDDSQPEPQRLRSDTLPLHSDELGKLPIWPGLDENLPPSSEAFGAIWPGLGDEFFINTGSFDYGQPSHFTHEPEFDATLASLFPDLGWGDMTGLSGLTGSSLEAEPYASSSHVTVGHSGHRDLHNFNTAGF